MATQLDPQTTKLYRVRKTVMQMLHDRKYLVQEEDLRSTKESFAERFGNDPKRDDLTIMKHLKDDPTEEIYVFFPEEAKVGVKTIKNIAENMKSTNVHRAILVVQQSPTPFAKQCLAEMAPKYNIEVFQESELLVNVKEHVLVPEHVVLNAEEKDVLLKRYTVKENQLPRIQKGDPVARYFGLQRGQVVKIIRNSETAGKYINYRLCV